MSQKFLSEVTLQALNNATTDTDRFLVSDSGTVKYRTGTQLLSDIGGQAALTNPITGTGTLNYVSKFTGTSTLGDSQIFDNSSGVGIGTTNPTFAKLKVSGASASGAIISEDTSGTTSFVRILGDISSQNLINWQSGTALRFATSTQDYASFSEAMRITSGGNVGIGTTSPSVAAGLGLVLNGQAGQTRLAFKNNYTGDTSSDGVQFALIGGSSAFVFQNRESDGYFSFETNSSERIRITDNGNVGIGTSSPAEKLEVQNGGSGAKIKVSNSAGGYASLECSSNATSVAQLSFTNQLSLIGGNVGIGTTSPSEKLHISGNTLVTGTLEVDTVNNGVGDFLTRTAGGIVTRRTAAEVRSDIGAQAALTNPVTGTGTLNFVSKFTSTGSTLGNSQIFDNGSSVGIGTSGPLNKVDIVSSNNDSFGAITVRPSNQTQTMSLGWQGVSASLNFIVNTGAVERMRITNTGNVGIGTSSPSALLNVYGNLHLGAYSNLSTVNIENRTGKSVFSISTDGVNNAIGTTITYSWADGGHGPLKFNNASGEVMRLDASGKLGVGTTNPTSRIHSVTSAAGPVSYDQRCAIYGDNTAVSTVYPNSVGVAGRVLTSDGRAIYGDATTGGGWGGYFDGKGYFSGNVGIGTSSPVDKLEVNGGIRSTGLNGFTRINDGVLSASRADGLYLIQEANAPMIMWTNNTERMRITSSGNVGIGISNPVAKLDVFSSGTVQTAVLGRGLDGNFRLVTAQDVSTNADQSVIGLIGLDYITTPNAAVRFHRGGSTTGGFITFTTNNGNEKMRITSAGNVGIGTTAPPSLVSISGGTLSVSGSGSGFGVVKLGDPTDAIPYVGVYRSAAAAIATSGNFLNLGGYDGIAFTVGAAQLSGQPERMRITSAGAMGLGVIPTNTSGRFEASNDIVAYSSSDRRWKTNIKNIDSPLEKISQINGVEFDWIEDEPVHGNKGHDIGVIAQEIEKILPDAVQTRESGMKAVKYEKVIPLLIESIKEQQKQIEELKQLLNGITN